MREFYRSLGVRNLDAICAVNSAPNVWSTLTEVA
jgi:hypothetical protein